MLSFPDSRWPRKFNDNPGKHLENSSLGARKQHLLVDRSSAWGKGLLDMLGLNQ